SGRSGTSQPPPERTQDALQHQEAERLMAPGPESPFSIRVLTRITCSFRQSGAPRALSQAWISPVRIAQTIPTDTARLSRPQPPVTIARARVISVSHQERNW